MGAESRGEALIRALAQAPMFAEYLDADLTRLASVARARSFDEGEVLFHREDPDGGLFVIVSGTIKLVVEGSDGREAFITLLGRGETVGEVAVLDGGDRSATAAAMQRVEAIYLPRDELLRFLDEHPAALRQLILILTRRLRMAYDHVAELVFHDVYGRLATKLLALTESHGRSGSNGAIEIGLPLTQQDLANLVGASRESVNKAIRQFRDDGLVAFAGQRITVLRPEELRERAEPS
jgi:CRP/FNR family cyclic AMP-dependent transcriptional regulator